MRNPSALDLNRIKNHLSKIARPRDILENPKELAEIQSYIEDEFRSYGYEIHSHAFNCEEVTVHNVIAQHSKKGPRFIIGAHFDGVPGTPGADDNASGVAAMLEAARILSPLKAAQSIDFIAFNGEEYGMIGSQHYVEQLLKDKRHVLGMISLEMVGYTDNRPGSQKLPFVLRPFYPTIGNFLALVGDGNSKTLLKQTKTAFKKIDGLPVESLTVPGKGFFLSATRLSDHSPFWDAGYPALLITDTSFFRNPHYHTPSDTLATLDLHFLTKVTEGVIQLALDLFE